MFFFFSISFFFFLNQFVLVVVYPISSAAVVSLALRNWVVRGCACRFVAIAGWIRTSFCAQGADATRRAKGKTILVDESDRFYRQCLPEQDQVR